MEQPVIQPMHSAHQECVSYVSDLAVTTNY